MNKKRTSFISVLLSLFLVAFVGVAIMGQHQRSPSIVLPQPSVDSDAEDSGADSSAINVVTITPSTVQPAINTLSRPIAYQRTQTVETFWSGGSGKSVSQVSVRGAHTRVDTTMADGSVCHMLVSGSTAAVWYDEETEWTTLSTARFSADLAQRMLSYEDILDLPVSAIEQAEYRQEDGIYCIYVQTHRDEEGYWERYWVSVSSGLLFKAERIFGRELIYRFTAPEPDTEPPVEGMFLLPDGTTLTVS